MGKQSGWQFAGLPMSAEDVQPILRVAKREAQALGQFLERLALEDWNRPSGAAGWQIGDVVGHLVKVGQAYRAFIARGLAGETGGAEATQPWPGLPEIRTRLSNAAVAAREEFGSDLQQAFVDAWDGLFSDMQGLAPEDWARPFPFALYQQQPPGAVALWAMQELAIHSWDVRSACDPRAQLSPDHLPALLERLSLRYALPRFAEFPTLATDSGSMRCRFELSRDIENRSYDIIVEDGCARLKPAAEETAQVVFRLSGSDFVLLFFQRHQAQALLDSGAMTAQGDTRLVTLFAHWLAGIEMP
jgi:uncharacterized protein (TIGR03083 family)